jgi:hypothetical protein
VEVLVSLANTDMSLYTEVLMHYLQEGNMLYLDSRNLVMKLIEASGVERAYHLLLRPDYYRKKQWLMSFFEVLPPNDASLERLAQLYKLYEEAEPGELPNEFDYLIK